MRLILPWMINGGREERVDHAPERRVGWGGGGWGTDRFLGSPDAFSERKSKGFNQLSFASREILPGCLWGPSDVEVSFKPRSSSFFWGGEL